MITANTSEDYQDRSPPHAIEAEQAILGSLLINGEVIARIVDQLRVEHFYRNAHQLIYRAATDLFAKGEPIDIVALSQYLKDHNELEYIGGRQYLTDLAMSVATTANLEYYARTVSDKALLRNLIRASAEIAASCYENIDTDLAVDKAEQLIFNVAQGKQLQQLEHVRTIVDKSFSRIEQRYENRNQLCGVPSGFHDLDNLTSGFQKSDLIILAARPSVGKTAFCLNIAQHCALEAGMPVAIFSLEMSKDQLVQRLLCSEAQIDANQLRNGALQAKDWAALAKAMGRLAESPIFIDDSPAVSVLDVRAKARRLKTEVKTLGLIIVDYIQLMQGRARADANPVQEVSEISRGLKTLARELETPVIALSQLSRAVESRPNKRPMLSDLRQSGSLEQDADIVMFIYREDYYDKETEHRGEAEIIVAKQRNGPVGDVKLLYHKSITRFLNMSGAAHH